MIERHQFYYREHLLNITMTFGVAGYELAMSLDDCLVLADRATDWSQEEKIDSGSWGKSGRFES